MKLQKSEQRGNILVETYTLPDGEWLVWIHGNGEETEGYFTDMENAKDFADGAVLALGIAGLKAPLPEQEEPAVGGNVLPFRRRKV